MKNSNKQKPKVKRFSNGKVLRPYNVFDYSTKEFDPLTAIQDMATEQSDMKSFENKTR